MDWLPLAVLPAVRRSSLVEIIGRKPLQGSPREDAPDCMASDIPAPATPAQRILQASGPCDGVRQGMANDVADTIPVAHAGPLGPRHANRAPSDAARGLPATRRGGGRRGADCDAVDDADVAAASYRLGAGEAAAPAEGLDGGIPASPWRIDIGCGQQAAVRDGRGAGQGSERTSVGTGSNRTATSCIAGRWASSEKTCCLTATSGSDEGLAFNLAAPSWRAAPGCRLSCRGPRVRPEQTPSAPAANGLASCRSPACAPLQPWPPAPACKQGHLAVHALRKLALKLSGIPTRQVE